MRHLIPLLLACTLACAEAPDPLEPLTPARGPASAAAAWVEARAPEAHALLEAPAAVRLPAEAEAAVSAPFRARIASVPVQVGDRVEAGAPLAWVVMPEVMEAAGKLAAAELRLGVHEARRKQLLALEQDGLVRATDRWESEVAMGEARAEARAAEATLGAAGLTRREAGKLLTDGGLLPLRSPIAGLVVEVDAPLGLVREADGTPLVRVAALASGRVVARFPASVPEGGTFHFLAPGREPQPLRLLAQAPHVDPLDGSRSYFFEAAAEAGARPEAPPAEPALLPGSSGRVRLLLPPDLPAVVVPARALLLQGGETFVIRRGGGKEWQERVRVLSLSGSEALVQGAIKAGEAVSADARQWLENQTAVEEVAPREGSGEPP